MSDDEIRDAAEHEETLIEADESAQDAESDWSPFEEIHEDFKPRPIPRVIGADGMPKAVLPMATSDIPALSSESLVCMGDYSSFVIRGAFGDPLAHFDASEVERAPFGFYRCKRELVLERCKMELGRMRKRMLDTERLSEVGAQAAVQSLGFDPREANDNELLHLLLNGAAQARGQLLIVNPDWVEVEPIRPPCRHYIRQKSHADFDPQIKAIFRLCAARRTTEGAFMSVRDRGIWACDMREPRDLATEKQLDEFDEQKMREGARREYVPMFGTGDGIFERKES